MWGGKISLRQRMLGDLVARVLPGHDRTEIEAILGPTETPSIRDGDLIYLLGSCRNLLPGDPEWLHVSFDRAGLFDRFAIYNYS
jgi:hypothetical protein